MGKLKISLILITIVCIISLGITYKNLREAQRETAFYKEEAQEYQVLNEEYSIALEQTKVELQASEKSNQSYLEQLEELEENLEDAKWDLDMTQQALWRARRIQSGFQTKEELCRWLRADAVSDKIYSGKYYDCEDFARDLQKNAKADGYWLGLLEIETGEVIFHGPFDIVQIYHAKNFAVIGSEIYEVEPQTDKGELLCKK